MSYLPSQRFPEKFRGQEQLKPSSDNRQVPSFLHGELAHDVSEILMTMLMACRYLFSRTNKSNEMINPRKV